jgi:hypothetical protein
VNALLALVLVSAAAGAPVVEHPLFPFQADLSAVAGLGERSAAGLALYVGAAAGPWRAGGGSPFGGLGFEFVQAASYSPFHASYGVQLRGGYAWSREGHDTPMADLLVFARVTPFVGTSTGVGDSQFASTGYTGPHPDGIFGVRVGVGVTSAWWTELFLFHRPFGGEERGFLGDALNVFTTLLLAPIGLLNHLELVGEIVELPGASTLTLRFGCGF